MKKILLALLLTGMFCSADAQNRNIVVLGGKSKSTSKKHKRTDGSTAIKVAAANFIAGNLPFCVEKEYNNFALLVGAGPTFKRFLDNSFWSGLLDDEEINYSWGNTSMQSVYNPFSYDSRPKFKYSPGYYFVVNPKYYYNEEGMDGGYFGIQLAMSQYNYKNPSYYGTNFTKSGKDRYTDLMVQWGAQYGEDKFVFEWFTGIGIRFKNEQRYAYGVDFSGNYLEGTALINRSTIHYDLGFRVGFKL